MVEADLDKLDERTRANFEKYLQLKRKSLNNLGMNLDTSDLAPEFIPYFINQYRIEVKVDGEEKPLRGRVGITTGWKPVFQLMLRRDSTGSAWTLGKDDHVLRVISA